MQRNTRRNTNLSRLDYRLFLQRSDQCEQQDKFEQRVDLRRFNDHFQYHLRSNNAPYDDDVAADRHEDTHLLQFPPLSKGNVMD